MKRIDPVLLLVTAVFVTAWSSGPDGVSDPERLVIEDFRGHRMGSVPGTWKVLEGRRLTAATEREWDESRSFTVMQEGNRRFVRALTHNRASRIILPNDDAWSLETHPNLMWEWRAAVLPEGAREDRVNDTGGALYVTFDMDWLGRPRSIKYTYSSSLPVGTVVSFGRLKVIVASSAVDGIGDWKKIERDVVADFRSVFRGDPPDRPLSIALWSDTDDTGGRAQVDFANIVAYGNR